MIELVLLVGLFEPRIALIIGFITNSILPNNIPNFWDVILFFIAPRILILIYLIINIETLPFAELWILAHAIGLLIEFINERIENRYGW